MKKTIPLFGMILTANMMFAQTTAQDWTKTDCSGGSHSLFADYLDQGKVVLLQFDMMNCGLCTSAAYYTDQIEKDFAISNPGKVKMISLGYTNTTTCAQMSSWKSSNSFGFTIIEKCPNEVAYYGGMGMPTIVVVGTSAHKVFYKKLGFSATTDDPAIRAAINTALTATGIEEKENLAGLNVYPNPVNNKAYVSYNLQEATDVKMEIYNIVGEKIQTIVSEKQMIGEHQFEINTNDLCNGIYFLNVNGKTLRLEVANQ